MRGGVNVRAESATTAALLNHPHFSDDSKTLPNHRQGVKDYFPITFGDIRMPPESQAGKGEVVKDLLRPKER
jgi:hypothetical protein